VFDEALLTVLRLSIIPLVPAIFLLEKFRWLRNDLRLNSAAIKQLGIGKPSGLFLFGGWWNWNPSDIVQQTRWKVLRDVTQANFPQLAISLAFYLWNSHLTVMLAAREYDTYAATSEVENGTAGSGNRRSLRVMNPQKGTDQKSTPLLTIPFKYWATNSLLWTTLHWLASQAVFFVRVDMVNHWQQISLFSVSQVGYSILGVICFLDWGEEAQESDAARGDMQWCIERCMPP
jgi:hypothetical protein